jgi:hypothetical protein
MNNELITKGIIGVYMNAGYDNFVLAGYKFGVRWYFDDMKI